MAKTNQQNEEELQNYKKKERLLNLDKKMLDNMQAKNVSMSKKLENKEEATKAFAEQIKMADKEIKTLKQQLQEKDAENKKLSKEYFVALEQLALYKEMMVRIKLRWLCIHNCDFRKKKIQTFLWRPSCNRSNSQREKAPKR